MKVINKVKDNLFIVFIALAYIVVFTIKPIMGIASIKNSVYYIKEMLMIMPVIFVLTSLLDLWIPKEKIMKYLGTEAKTKGVVLSLVLGSISAGPIYAAFPLCVMLHKKGASIRNLVIILSAWAVIKVPMLLNELKFLGLQFMAVRWVLTVIAIVVFSWITAKIVKDGDLPQPRANQSDPTINKSACMGCSLCTKYYPELFMIQNKKASIKAINGVIDQEKLMTAVNSCPVKAISFICKQDTHKNISQD
ncbi:MAG: permease [Clostridiaceae bacterium]|nr:permease [Clostridiaceae bacterium]